MNLYAYCRSNPVFYVDPRNATNCMKEAYKEALAAGMSSHPYEAYQAAQNAYAQNYTDNLRPTV